MGGEQTDYAKYTRTSGIDEVHESSHNGNFLSDAYGYVKGNLAAPLLNAAVIEPGNTLIRGVNAVSHGLIGHDAMGKMGEMKIADAQPYSAEWFMHTAAGGLGALVPYTIAGKAANRFFRAGSVAVGAEGMTAAVLRSEQFGFIGGAFAYDGLKETRPGETWYGNALGGAAGFAVFGMGNKFITPENQILKAGAKIAVGAMGADTQQLVAQGVQGKRPTLNALTEGAVGGAAMNMFLPKAQEFATKHLVNAEVKSPWGAPVDEYVKVRNPGAADSSPQLASLVESNGDARVRVRQYSDFDSKGNRVDIASNRELAGTLGAELTHLQQASAGRSESSFQDAAAKVVAGNRDAGWQAFRQTRAQQEVAAHDAGNGINRDVYGLTTIEPQHLAKEIGAWPAPGGVSFEQRWRQEFTQFESSSGQWRPGTKLGTTEAFQPDKSAAEKKALTPEEQAKYRSQEIASGLVSDLQREGYIGVFAGGSVRDAAMGKLPHDYDIATSAPPAVVQKLFEDKGYRVITTGKQFGVINVIAHGEQFEIATLRNDGQYSDGRRPDSVKFVSSLYEDAARRDLTINSMFSDPTTNVRYDFFNGQSDINNRLIRTVGDPDQRFAEDALRMMRVPRFASRLQFSVDPTTFEAIQAHAQDINKVSGERIAKELKGTLESPRPSIGLEIMHGTGLLGQPSVLPEVAATAGPKGMQDPRWHPEGSTWTHTKMVVDEIAGGSFERSMGALLHDIGKPGTQKINADGTISNTGHAELGASMVPEIANRLKLSNSQRDQIQEMVLQHMKMHKIDEMKPGKLYDILNSRYIDDMVALQHADAMGTGRNDGMDKSRRDWIGAKREELASSLTEKPIIGGKELVSMGIKPSPRLGEIKTAAFDAQREGKFNDPASARQWLEENIPELKAKTSQG